MEFRFGLTRPCCDCPFRKDVRPYLSDARAQEIAKALERQTFACHKTAHGKGSRKRREHCAGALIVMLKEGKLGDMQQIAMRLGLWNPDGMDLTSPCFNSLKAFVAANRREHRADKKRRGES